MRLLLLDNFDSFTYTLVDYLQQAGADCVVRRNNVLLETLIGDAYDAVVLSPGPGTPTEAGCLMDVVHHYHNRLPMLGVCLGQQAIGQYFGASLVRSAKPMHGKVSTIQVDTNDALFQGVASQIRVTRYHSLTLTNLPAELLVTAVSNEDGVNEIMAIRHREYPVWGVQFHPEAVLTESGLSMLRNFIQSTKPVSTL
ncbi:anthranilate synthase component II [Fibrella forsythiae]|uniref:Aminodeoxychorismate/anthranilate synthase component II n=1 Tax=Fibrella forsythiae TaxID=2817061 RepID=A0ABS3JCE0_9BACT|nr:aminodeoxychorismate/anthranilate synthase component II [Fibrella forsythiae]MBO0947101.1 aminodeoxychorismate/anthranilate synthase component II [Fibrella forsythiae]